VACERALDMVNRNYFSHTNPDRYGPDYFVRQAGYVLPSYDQTHLTANKIESIASHGRRHRHPPSSVPSIAGTP
jgi:hypothetical protein